jgi:hypothetical protein
MSIGEQGGKGGSVWLKSFAWHDSSQPLLCGAEGAVCKVFMEDSQIIFEITNCNMVDPRFNELIGGGGVS